MNTIFDKAKYIVAKQLFISVSICFFILSVVNYIADNIFFKQTVLALFITLTSLIYLTLTKDYRRTVIFTLIVSSFDHIIGFTFESDHHFQASLLWIINSTILAYYILNKKYALYYIVVNFFNLFLIKSLIDVGIITAVPRAENSMATNISYYINMLFGLSVFLYQISIITRETRQAELKLISSNQKLQLQDEEKTLMLKEIHHRVKNNLQVITSLLKLQMNKFDDEHIKAPLQESINRVSTMALIHTKMYQGDSVNNLDLQLYIDDLSNDLIQAYPNECKVEIEINSSLKALKLNDLVPFSLIVNELITNSIKHGFKNKSEGKINIDIEDNGQAFQVKYNDNGEWQEPSYENSFGLELIETLTWHFDGDYSIDTNTGTTYLFNLNLA